MELTARPRPYLRADARRRQLLDAAARVFVQEGYAGLTMVALGAEAGVSRRLVYDHFPDLATLYDAFFDDRASRYLASIDQALADADGDGDVLASFSAAFGRLLAIPADDQRAIRLLITDPARPELERVRDRFRAHVEQRWMPFVRAAFVREDSDRGTRPQGPDDLELGRALLWTLVNGLFGLADLVARDEISAGAATTLAAALVATLPSVITNVSTTRH